MATEFTPEEASKVIDTYGIDFVGFMTKPGEAIPEAVEKAKGILARLEALVAGPKEVQSYSEFKKNSSLSDEQTARLAAFKTDLDALLHAHGIYDENDLLVAAIDSLQHEATTGKAVLESNLIRTNNVQKASTVSRKQLHRDYVVARALILQMAAPLAAAGLYKSETPLSDLMPSRGGNFSDDLAVTKAEAVFYSHAYTVEFWEKNGDGQALSKRRHFERGTNPASLASFLGMLSTLTRHGIIAFMEALAERFGWCFEDLEAIAESESTWAAVETDNGKVVLFIEAEKMEG